MPHFQLCQQAPDFTLQIFRTRKPTPLGVG